MSKLKRKADHSTVRTLGFLEQGKLFASKPPEKKVSKRAIQIFRDAVRSRKELGRIVRRQQHKGDAILPVSYSSAMSLANLLFPKNFPRIIATGLKEEGNLHSSIVYSQLVPLTRESQRGIECHYSNSMQRRGLTPFQKHSASNKNSILEATKRIEESGLFINPASMNVGIRENGAQKSFVFFEVEGIDLFKIKKYINNLPVTTDSQKLLKAQAERLVGFIESQKSNNSNLVGTHVLFKSRIKKS
jgi:hypothetical protein